MLTVKAPIELKCNTDMVSSWEMFYHRISGNYEVMSSGIDHEDLLHVMSVPPEVYIADGEMSSLVNNTRIQNHQETKLEIINNLLNRIALTEQADLTYQDRVYITEVLNKLGIQNVSRFMDQVFALKQETRTTERLISLYWNHLEELNRVVQQYSHVEKAGKTVTENLESRTDLRLHEEIMNRLQTGAVYQILSNFYSSYNNSNQYVSGPELQITEQKRVAANILLNRLKNVVREDKVPLVYRHENYYETMNLEENLVDQDTMNARITSAVLLNLVDNLYFSRFERQLKKRDTWLNMKNALYQTMDNTLWRLKNETSSHFDTRNSKNALTVYQRQVFKQELEAVYQLLALGQEDAPETGRNDLIRLYNQIISEENRYEGADIRYPAAVEDGAEQEKGTGEEEVRDNRPETDLRLERETERLLSEYSRFAKEQSVVNQGESRNQILTETYESPLRQDKEEQGGFLPTEVSLPQDQENYFVTEENNDQQTLYSQEENLTAIERQIKQINQQNIENFNRYQEILRQQEGQKKTVRPSAERMRQESLMALENPDQFIEEYRQETSVIQQQNLVNLSRFTELLPEQTRKIYERLEQYQSSSKQPGGHAQATRDNIGLLLHDIQQIERENVTAQSLSQKDMDQIRRMSETVLEKWEERQGAEIRSETRTTDARSDISLVHKSIENQVDEELLQQLFEQNRTLSSKVRVTENEKVETQVNRTWVQQQTQSSLIKETEDLTELIQRGVQRQIGSISDQVYSKLEKRLQNEKKRRGY
ncbi:MAG: hypothetical protein HDR02_02620 [Lachnospiraceae bacterium]|nr:hypothetical protein [Lachnospiraceae bacterium]